jgi:hypothetical protein
MGHNFEKLKEHILPLSHSTAFHIAKNEWKLVDVKIWSIYQRTLLY